MESSVPNVLNMGKGCFILMWHFFGKGIFVTNVVHLCIPSLQYRNREGFSYMYIVPCCCWYSFA
jgi:hypothetical protein